MNRVPRATLDKRVTFLKDPSEWKTPSTRVETLECIHIATSEIQEWGDNLTREFSAKSHGFWPAAIPPLSLTMQYRRAAQIYDLGTNQLAPESLSGRYVTLAFQLISLHQAPHVLCPQSLSAGYL